MLVTLSSIFETVDNFDYLIEYGRPAEARDQAWKLLGYEGLNRELFHICEGFGWVMVAQVDLLHPKVPQTLPVTEKAQRQERARAPLVYCEWALRASNSIQSWRVKHDLRRRCGEFVVEAQRMIDGADTVETDELADALERMAVCDVAEAMGIDMAMDDDVEGVQEDQDIELDRLLAKAMAVICIDRD